MKANEFVKKFGLEEASEIVAGVPEKFRFKCLSNVCWDNNTYKYSDRFKPRLSLVNMSDLKRLVESHELVQPYMDRESGQWFFIADYCKKNRISPFDSGNYEKAKKIYLQAIADVESCK